MIETSSIIKINPKTVYFYSYKENSMYKLPNGKMVYPEDIECVHESINGKGGIYVGNLEAAQNLQTLKSTFIVIQNSASRLSSLQPRASSSTIPKLKFFSNCTFQAKTIKDLTWASILISPSILSETLSKKPIFWSIVLLEFPDLSH